MKIAIITILALVGFVAPASANNCEQPNIITERIVGVAPNGTVVWQFEGGVMIVPPRGKHTGLTYQWPTDGNTSDGDDSAAPVPRWRVSGPKPPLDPKGLSPADYLAKLGTKLGLTPLVEEPATFDFTWYGAHFSDMPRGIVRLVLPEGPVPLIEVEGDNYSANHPPELTFYKHPHLSEFVLHVSLNIGAECGDWRDQMHIIAPSAIAAKQKELRERPGLDGARREVERSPGSFTARMRLLAALGELSWREVPSLRVPVPRHVTWRSVYFDQLRDRFDGDEAFDAWIAKRR